MSNDCIRALSQIDIDLAWSADGCMRLELTESDDARLQALIDDLIAVRLAYIHRRQLTHSQIPLPYFAQEETP